MSRLQDHDRAAAMSTADLWRERDTGLRHLSAQHLINYVHGNLKTKEITWMMVVQQELDSRTSPDPLPAVPATPVIVIPGLAVSDAYWAITFEWFDRTSGRKSRTEYTDIHPITYVAEAQKLQRYTCDYVILNTLRMTRSEWEQVVLSVHGERDLLMQKDMQ